MLTLDNLLYTFCHHKPDRLLQALGGTSLLCARCDGIYLGFILGFLFLFLGLRRRGGEVSFRGLWLAALLCAVLPAEVAVERFAQVDPGNFFRYLTGLSLGAGFSVIIVSFWGVFFPEMVKAPLIRSSAGATGAAFLFTGTAGSILVALLFFPAIFDTLVMLSLGGAYIAVNSLLARGVLGLKNVASCLWVAAGLTLVEWGVLFFVNNAVLARRF